MQTEMTPYERHLEERRVIAERRFGLALAVASANAIYRDIEFVVAALLLPFGALRELLLTSWARAVISAFGLLHLVWGLHDVDLFLRRSTGYALEDSAPARHQ